MITDRIARDRALALLLDSDDIQTIGMLYHSYKRRFGNDAADFTLFQRAVSAFVREDVLIEYDVESEMADGLVVDHSEHGQLSPMDLTYIGFEELVAIGPLFVSQVRERSSEIMDQAIQGALDGAVKRMRDLPIESWKWTGLPERFVFDEVVQSRVVKLLHDADFEIGRNGGSNFDVSQVRALVKAAIVLADAPKPQPDMVWELVQRVSAFASILSAVQGLFSIFMRPGS